MNRRFFLQRSLAGLAMAGLAVPEKGLGGAGLPASGPVGAGASGAGGSIRPMATPAGHSRRLEMPATLQARAFASSIGDDQRYHALVYEGGGAAGKALLTTPVSDRDVARRLREAGAEDGGGVPMSAWNLRRLPLVSAPDSRVAGTPIRITIELEEWTAPRDLSSLVDDPGGRGVAFRFGGNEEHDDRWESGCIACFFSCPGGVVSNDRYSIRDYVREVTRFYPASDLPLDEIPVTVTIEVL